MTADPTIATNGQTSTDKNKKGRGRNKTGKRNARSGRGRSKQGSRGSGASRLMSQGKQVLGDAYSWASNSAGRALPRAARYVPDQETMRNVLEERPLVLGAIGLGLGAIIGMMLPSHLLGVKSSNARRSNRSKRKS